MQIPEIAWPQALQVCPLWASTFVQNWGTQLWRYVVLFLFFFGILIAMLQWTCTGTSHMTQMCAPSLFPLVPAGLAISLTGARYESCFTFWISFCLIDLFDFRTSICGKLARRTRNQSWLSMRKATNLCPWTKSAMRNCLQHWRTVLSIDVALLSAWNASMIQFS